MNLQVQAALEQVKKQFIIEELNVMAAALDVENQSTKAIKFQIALLEFLSKCYEDGGWRDADYPHFHTYDQDEEGFYIDKSIADKTQRRVAQVIKSDLIRAAALKRLANIIGKRNSIYFLPDHDGWFDGHQNKIKRLNRIAKRPAIVIFYKRNGQAIADNKTICFLDDERDCQDNYKFYNRYFRFDSSIKLKNIIAGDPQCAETRSQNQYFLQQQIYAATSPSEQNHLGTTHQLYRWLSWYNYMRIFSIGIYLTCRVIFDFSPVTTQFFHAVFGFAGLVFALEIILDTAMLIKAARKNSNGPVEQEIPWYTRVWNTFKKDGRSARMINAVLWVGINLACFILTGGIGSPIALIETTVANLIGFGLDLINTLVHSSRAVTRLESVYEKTTNILSSDAEKKIAPDDKTYDKQWLLARAKQNPETSAIAVAKEKADSARKLGAFLVVLSILAGFGTFAATGISLGLFSIGIPVYICTLITAGFYLLNGFGLCKRRWDARVKTPEPESSAEPGRGSTGNVGKILGIDLKSVKIDEEPSGPRPPPPPPPGGGLGVELTPVPVAVPSF